MKIIGCVLLCCFVMGQIVNGVIRPMVENSFAAQVGVANQNCPIPLALGKGNITSMSLKDGYLVYTIAYDKEFDHILANVKDEKKAKEALMLCFLCINAQGNNQGNILMDKLVEEGYGMKVIITQSASGYHEYAVTADDIRVFSENMSLNPHEALHRMLEISIESERNQLPMPLEEGMMMTDYYLEKENLVLTIELDETIYDMEACYGMRDEVKNAMLEVALTDPITKSMFDMCKVTHTGFIYRIVGKQSGEKFDVLISNLEIRMLIPTPSQVNIK